MKKYESVSEEGRNKWLCSQCSQCSQCSKCSQSAVEYLRLLPLPVDRTALCSITHILPLSFSFSLDSPASFPVLLVELRTSQEFQSTLTELQIRICICKLFYFVRANSADFAIFSTLLINIDKLSTYDLTVK